MAQQWNSPGFPAGGGHDCADELIDAIIALANA
jgi:hypothetical protein